DQCEGSGAGRRTRAGGAATAVVTSPAEASEPRVQRRSGELLLGRGERANALERELCLHVGIPESAQPVRAIEKDKRGRECSVENLNPKWPLGSLSLCEQVKQIPPARRPRSLGRCHPGVATLRPPLQPPEVHPAAVVRLSGPQDLLQNGLPRAGRPTR